MAFRLYAICCPDCDENEVLTDGERRMGDLVDCDKGHVAFVVPAMPRAVGILVEREDKQLGRTFKSNAEYNDYLKYGNPITNDQGEVVGHKQIGEMSGDEKREERERVIASLERTARKNGLTLHEAHARRSELVREKRAKEIEAGQTPSVSEPKPMTYA
jgi:hypothetical protein